MHFRIMSSCECGYEYNDMVFTFLLNFLFVSNSSNLFRQQTLQIMHKKGTIQWKLSMTKAHDRGRDFLTSHVACRAIPWQFEFKRSNTS